MFTSETPKSSSIKSIAVVVLGGTPVSCTDETRRLYKKLKGIRSEIRRTLKQIEKELAERNYTEEDLKGFDEEIVSLVKKKRRLRKEFRELTGR